MAKKGDPCYRCSGGKLLPQYSHVDSGRCFRCAGTGIDPGPDTSPRQYRELEPHKKKPRPDAARAKWLADEAFIMVAERFHLAEAGKQKYGGWQDEFSSLEELYMSLGHHLAMAVFDPRFDRAIERARARVPAQYRKAFEANLAQGIRQWANDYEGIEWRGR